jgi:glutamate synthase (NADPH/NADH)
MIEMRSRKKVALIVESAEAREVHHICVLLGYGADAICPYLALELASSLRDQGILDTSLTDEAIFQNYAQAMQTGINKVMAKMGISTLQSYKGAQIFEAVGLADDVIDKCFKGKDKIKVDVLVVKCPSRNTVSYWRRHFGDPRSRIVRETPKRILRGSRRTDITRHRNLSLESWRREAS